MYIHIYSIYIHIVYTYIYTYTNIYTYSHVINILLCWGFYLSYCTALITGILLQDFDRMLHKYTSMKSKYNQQIQSNFSLIEHFLKKLIHYFFFACSLQWICVYLPVSQGFLYCCTNNLTVAFHHKLTNNNK